MKYNLERKIKFLDKEPKRTNNKLTQIIYFFTRPIAEMFDNLDYWKSYAIDRKREEIAIIQKWDFVKSVAEILYSQVLAKGTPKDEQYCKILCIKEAEQIFLERKENNGFDDLNIML